MFVWRNKQNYHLIITKYPSYLFHPIIFCLQSQFNSYKADKSKEKPQQSSRVSSSTKSSDDWGWGSESSSTYQSQTDTYKHEVHSDASEKSHKGALKLGGGPKKAPADDFSWIEEEFAPIEDSSVAPASSYNWGQSDDTAGNDFFSATAGISTQVGELIFD